MAVTFREIVEGIFRDADPPRADANSRLREIDHVAWKMKQAIEDLANDRKRKIRSEQ